ncbi:hypothetical protein CRE_05209 [Caenorhabditis remanei]|uniref:Uncharacterized protein n=1 Tax=Caenorhabditis remanei TaxID=31234 RepID=E3NEA2_CAERE|nr:hypothetical protein CRE_05209 [Caenorhabditis remanei]
MGLLDLRTSKTLPVNQINVDKRESMTSSCYNANNDILYASIYLESNNETISSKKKVDRRNPQITTNLLTIKRSPKDQNDPKNGGNRWGFGSAGESQRTMPSIRDKKNGQASVDHRLKRTEHIDQCNIAICLFGDA